MNRTTKAGFFATVIAVLCLSGHLTAHAAKPIEVFLLGGQSNMAGVGVFAEAPAPYSEALPNVKIWDSGKWVSIPEFAADKPTCGPEISFAHAIAKVLPDTEIRLVKYALGGTALYNDWAPVEGPQYVEFMKTAEPALADLDARGGKYRIAGMLWLQGESDAHENMAADYKKNLKTFIEHIRTKFNTPDMPFIIARVLAIYGGSTGQAAIVRDAQVSVARSVKNVEWFDTDDCELLGNGAHYNTVGLIKIGERFAKAYQKALKAQSP